MSNEPDLLLNITSREPAKKNIFNEINKYSEHFGFGGSEQKESFTSDFSKDMKFHSAKTSLKAGFIKKKKEKSISSLLESKHEDLDNKRKFDLIDSEPLSVLNKSFKYGPYKKRKFDLIDNEPLSEPSKTFTSGFRDAHSFVNKQKANRNKNWKSPPKVSRERSDFSLQKFENKFSNQNFPRSVTQIKKTFFHTLPEVPEIKKVEVKPSIEQIFSNKTFADISLHPYMVSNLEKRFGCKQLTAIQEKTIPVILKGSDVMIKSQTGSGKTLAFAIPIVEALGTFEPEIKRSDGIFGLIIVPTRELVTQTLEIFQKLLKPWIRIVPSYLMGGERKKVEKARIRKGVNVLISTPGRLLDHTENTTALNFSNLRWLVVDEADRLLELGYEMNIVSIIKILTLHQKKPRQTLLLSATLSEGVKRIAGMSLKNPILIDVMDNTSVTSHSLHKKSSLTDEKFAVPEHLEHYFVVVPAKLRFVLLLSFIYWKSLLEDEKKMLIFLATQDSVDFHFQLLNKFFGQQSDFDEDDTVSRLSGSVEFFQLHGSMSQQDRVKIFKQFREIQSGVLLCTDVASRGLDLPKVDWIIQYNTPSQPVDYIHRVGRTARIGSHGQALIFLLPSEIEFIKVLGKYNIRVGEMKYHSILQILEPTPPVSKKEMKHFVQMTIAERASKVQQKFESYVNSYSDCIMSARKAYISFIRAYATYTPDLRVCFNIKDLHLGHIATSFGLQENPKNIGQFLRFAHITRHSVKDIKTKKKRAPKRKPVDVMDEFASGL